MKNRAIATSSGLLIILWTYTSGSKLLEFAEFKQQLYLQNLGEGFTSVLSILIPLIELTIVVLLVVSATKKIGLIISFVLLSAFTIYILLILSGIYNAAPCSCGGILKFLSWKNHLYFNLSFLILNSIGIYFITNKERRPRQAVS